MSTTKKTKSRIPTIMPDRDIILAVLQSDIAVAGLVLVFSGFLITKAETYQTRYGDKFRWFAVCGFIPVIAAGVAAWICVSALQGSGGDATAVLVGLKIILALTGIYAIIAAIAFFP
jgi:hypothetical protein